MRIKSLSIWIYSKTCLKRPLKRRSKIDFQDREHSAILSTFIKLPFAIKIFVLSNFWVTVEDRFYCRPVLGAQSNHLIETVLLSYTQNICFCWEQGWSTRTRTCTRTYSSTFFSVLSCTLYLVKFMSTCTRTYLSTVTKNLVLMSTLRVLLSTFF